MRANTLEQQMLISSDIRINLELINLNLHKKEDLDKAIFFKTLPERGLDRLTKRRIEYIICTSALCSHI